MTDHRTIVDFTEGRVHYAGDPGFEERWAAHTLAASKMVTSCSGVPASAIADFDRARRKRDRRRRLRRFFRAFTTETAQQSTPRTVPGEAAEASDG